VPGRIWFARYPDVRVRRNLLRRINLICPVQSGLQKYSASRFTQIKSISIAIPSHTEGRFAIVTDVGHGMRWTRMVLLTNSVCADGEVVRQAGGVIR
jgi:hypothetical protein